MKGIVIHSHGHFRRCLEGRNNEYQLTVGAPVARHETPLNNETIRNNKGSPPVYFIFYCDGKPFAGSDRVVVAKGRRYPDVEHWFILPDETRQRSQYPLKDGPRAQSNPYSHLRD